MNACANYAPICEAAASFAAKSPALNDRPGIQVVRSTKTFVDRLLANNPNNRSISQGRVKALADDIRNGRWKFNGDTIVVDANGRLLDGQHRLSAIRAAGYPSLDLLVVTLQTGGDKSKDVFMTIDCGRPRTMSDTLHTEGTRYAGTTAAVARLIVLIAKQFNTLATKAEMMSVIKAYEQEIKQFAPFTQKKNGVIKFTAPAVTAMVLAAQAFGAHEQVQEFAMRLHTGIGIGADEPERRLLTYLVANRSKHVTRLTQLDVLCTTYRAIHHRLKRNGKPCRSIRGDFSETAYAIRNQIVQHVGSEFGGTPGRA